MNILTIISLICLLLYIELGIYVLAKSPKTNINRAFFSLSLCLAIWSFAFVFIYEAQCPEKAYQWYKLSAVGWGLAPAFMIKFLSHLTNYPKKNLNKNILFYTLILLSLYIIILVFTKNWIINEFKTHEDFWHLSFNYPSIYFSFYMFFI